MAEKGRIVLHCHRCVYSWRPRTSGGRICPRCKSHLWKVPKIRLHPTHPAGLGVLEILQPHARKIATLRRSYGVSSFRVFGSVARGEARTTSDVDLLVEFDRPTDFLTMTSLRMDLERLLGRKVDLLREATLKWSVRPQIMADAIAV